MNTVVEAEHKPGNVNDSHLQNFMKRSGLPFEQAVEANRLCADVVARTLAEGLGIRIPGLGGIYLHENFKVVGNEIERRMQLRFRPGRMARLRIKRVGNEFREVPTKILRAAAHSSKADGKTRSRRRRSR